MSNHSPIRRAAAVMGLAFLGAATLTTLWEFYVYYGILATIGFAGCGAMANAVLVARWYVRGRAKMLARSAMGMNVGQLVFLPLTGWLIVASGFRGALLTLGILMLVVVTPLEPLQLARDVFYVDAITAIKRVVP